MTNREKIQEFLTTNKVDHSKDTVKAALGFDKIIDSVESGEVDVTNLTYEQEILMLEEAGTDQPFMLSVMKGIMTKEDFDAIDAPSQALEHIIKSASQEIYDITMYYGFAKLGSKMKRRFFLEDMLKELDE